MRQYGTTRSRRPSRLSEGSSCRPLDYGIQYPGKTPEVEILQGPRTNSTRRLSVRLQGGAGRANRLYYGDNLGLLRALCDDPEVRGKVALVYIDPPFATGSSFESRDAQAAYEDLAVGARFLEFLRQRLVLLRVLLAPTGSIYLHLGGKMAFPVKVVMDEVFGPANFRNWITRKKSNRKNSTTRQYGNIADYVLFYTKSDHYVWNRPYEAWTEEWVKTEYPCVEEETGRRYKKVPVHAPGVRNGETGKPWRGKLPPPGKHWQFPPSVLEEMDARGEIYWSPTGNPRRKLFFEKSQGVAVQDIWMEFRDAHNQNVHVTGYPTEKNLGLLRRIVNASSNPGDLVLDCFAGSGTTLVAAEEGGRRWVGVDSSFRAIDTTIKRFAQGSTHMGDFVNGKKGRRKEEPNLFSSRLLETSLDLYAAEGPALRRATDQAVRAWASLFPTDSASIPA